MSFIKQNTNAATIREISDILTRYINNNTVSTEELNKLRDLLLDTQRATQLIKLL